MYNNKTWIFFLPEVDLDFKLLILSHRGTQYNLDLATKRSYVNISDLVMAGYLKAK